VSYEFIVVGKFHSVLCDFGTSLNAIASHYSPAENIRVDVMCTTKSMIVSAQKN
jgi:hypothetical protein